MDIIEFMIPGGILLALVGLWFFFWTVRASQYEDMEGAANRILLEEDVPSIPVQTIEPPSENR